MTDAQTSLGPVRTTLAIGAAIALDGVYVVEEGEVELYVALPTSRRFLGAMSKGAALLGCAEGVALTVFAPEGAKLTRLSDAAFCDAAAKVTTRIALVKAIEDWVTTISLSLATLAGARPETRACAAGDHIAASRGQSLSAAQSVVWLCASTTASLRLMGAATGKPQAAVISGSWAELSEDAAVEALSTSDLLVRDWRAALDAFTAAASEAARALAGRDLSSGAVRFAEREQRTLETLSAIERQWGSVLAGDETPEAVLIDDFEYAFAAAAGGAATDGETPRVSERGRKIEELLEGKRILFRAVTLSDDWFRADRGAMIGILADNGKPVALVPDWRGRYFLKERGRRSLRINRTTAARVARRAYPLTPPLPDRALRPKDLAALAFAYARIDFLTLIVAGLLGALLGLAIPIATRAVIDTFVPDGLGAGLIWLAVVLALTNVAGAMFHAAAELSRLRIDGRLATVVSSGALDRALRLPTRVLENQSSADLSSRLISIDQNRRTLSAMTSSAIVGGATAIATLALMIFYAPIAAAAATAAFAILLAASAYAGVVQNRALAPRETHAANLLTATLQIVQNMSALRAFGAERLAYAHWSRIAAAQRARGFRSRLVGVRYETFVAVFDGLATAFVFVALAYGAGGRDASIGIYFAFLSAFQQFLAAGDAIGRTLLQLIAMQPSLKRSALILGTPPAYAAAAQAPEAFSGRVEIVNVSFRHAPNLPLAIDRVSLRVAPGQFVALVGPSGSGKSSLINLILGLERPDAGAILFDGVDLAKLDKTAVRRNIGVVRQNGRLIPGTIYENLTGLHEGRLEDAWEAAELAGVAQDIRALPMGMHTLVTEGQSSFSGGQVQRLLIARALIGKPRLLLLDEATSALDGRTQAEVMGAIERLGVSRIAVAHRLSTVRRADVIHFVEGGRIVQSGRFEELMNGAGPFVAFARRQLAT